MPKAFAPFGAIPTAALGTHSNQVRYYGVANNSPALGRGTPVKMTAGALVSLGGSGNGPILGVCQGFQWIDSASKRPVIQNFLPAGTSSGGVLEGETRPVAMVVDNEDAIFLIQANASVSIGDVGLNFNVTAATADPEIIYGNSTYALQASSRTSAIGTAFKLVGLSKVDDNLWSDPFPWVLVKMNGPILQQVSAA